MKETISKSLKRLITTTTTAALMMLLVISPLLPIISFPQQANAASPFGAVWVNDGRTLIFQEDRPASHPVDYIKDIISYIWDGSTIKLKGAKNEVVDFNLMLEGNDSTDITGVSVVFDTLTGPNGYELKSKQVTGNDVFDYVDREIELFHIGYPQWNAISNTAASGLGSSFVTQGLFRYDNTAKTRQGWHKHVPDIATPIELVNPQSGNTFTVEHGKHQAIWADVYIPRDAPAGTYAGNVIVKINQQTNETIPVQLIVHDFVLNDAKTSRNIALLSFDSVLARFYNNIYTDYIYYEGADKPEREAHMLRTVDNIRKMAHRHRVNLDLDAESISTPNLFSYAELNSYPTNGNNPPPTFDPAQSGDVLKAHLTKWLGSTLDGSLYTVANNYEGPGENIGEDVHMIWPYFTATVRGKDDSDGLGMYVLDTDPKEINSIPILQWWPRTKHFLVQWAPVFNEWFAEHSPNADYFYYAIDELVLPTPWTNELARLLDQIEIPQNGKKMRVYTTRPPVVMMTKDADGGAYNGDGYQPDLGRYELVDGPPVGMSKVRVFLAETFPYVDIWAYCSSAYGCDDKNAWLQAIADAEGGGPNHETDHFGIHYNGRSPFQSGFEIDGEYLRALEWVNQKFQPGNVHFYFMSNLWVNDAFGYGDQVILNIWEDVHTHGVIGGSLSNPAAFSNEYGLRWLPNNNDGGTYESGSGLLLYPGTDVKFPQHNYNVEGAIASLRMKFWRRSIQDAEYIIMAREHNSALTEKIVSSIVPRGLWETQSDNQIPESDKSLGFTIDGNSYAKAIDVLTKIIKEEAINQDVIPPTVSIIHGAPTVRVGQQHDFAISMHDDVDANLTYWGQWGDGTEIATTTVQSGTTTISHIYTDSGIYEMKIFVKDLAGNITRVRKKNEELVNNIVLAITQVHVGDAEHPTTDTSATIFWFLTDNATGQVEYGLTPAYGMSNLMEHSFEWTGHRQKLTRLSPGTTYHFRTKSQNKFGDTVVSEDHTFTTTGTATSTQAIIATVTAVPAHTGPSPEYVFYSTQAGTITYGGACSSETTQAIEGNNSVTFNPLSIGTYNDCTIQVSGSVGTSNLLTISPFEVISDHDITPPNITLDITGSKKINEDQAMSITITDNISDEITYWGQWGDGTEIATSTISADTQASLQHQYTFENDFTIYLFAQDGDGNIASTTKTLNILDGQFKIIQGPYVSIISNNTARIEWGLSEGGTGELYYGSVNPDIPRIPSETTHNYNYHAQTISGLESCHTYHFKVVSENSAGLSVESPTSSFVTDGCGNDVIAPSISLISIIPPLTQDTTPKFSFSSTESGMIEYIGDCSSLNVHAFPGINITTLNELPDGTYTNCAFKITDASGNASQPLQLGQFTIQSSTSTSTPIRADINEDGGVSVADAQLILRKAMNLSVTTWPSAVTAGDVNCSGTINVADAQLTLRRVMNLEVNGWCDMRF